METYRNIICINCGSRHLKRFLDLADQPNGNHFPDEQSKFDEPLFPFAMSVCTACWQVQLEEYPPPEFMFSDHPYITGINVPVVNHFKKLSSHIIDKFALPKHSLIIDIGCNDGTLLSFFARHDMRVLGVDPGSLTGDLCRTKGINVCQTFWSKTTGRSLKNLNLVPRVITATAVFYHISDLHDFVDGLEEVMDNETVYMAQCIYLKDILEKNQFDHFYHEHITIHSLAPLNRLFNDHGMRVFDVEFDPIHGGSFLIYVCRNTGIYPVTKRLTDALIIENDAGLYQFETYQKFSHRVEQNRDTLINVLSEIKQAGKTVFGLCAPVKGSTLLNYAKIGPDLIDAVVEINPYKIGKLTPGTHIPIIDEKQLEKQPDYFLLMSWNFLDFFVEKYNDYLKSGGKFIVPNPSVRIMER